MINVPSVPSPYEQHLNDCDECGMPMHFKEIVENNEGEFELMQCPCGYTECLVPAVDNDNLDDLFIVE